MPLPTNPKQSWPPRTENRDDLATWSAWYSGDPRRLMADAAPRQQSSTVARLFFWKGRGHPKTGRPKPGIHLPLAGEVASVSADMLFGDAFDLVLRDEKATSRLDELRATTSLQNQLLEGAEICAALGGVYLRASWDVAVADEAFLTTVLPDHAVPDFRYGRLAAVTFWREVDAGDHQTDVVYRHLERHEPGVVLHGLYRGERNILGNLVSLDASPATAGLEDSVSLPEQLARRLDVVYVPNVRPDKRRPTSPQGRADIEGTETLLDALDEAYTAWMREIRVCKSYVVVPSGALEPGGTGRGSGRTFDADREVFTELELDAAEMGASAITPVEFDLKTQSYADTALHLVERIVSESGYSPQTFGLRIEGRAESGTALKLREARTFKTVARKQRYWAPRLAEACELLLVIEKAVFGRDLAPERPAVTWPEETATPQETAETLVALHAAEAVSIETSVRMVHPDWGDDKVAAEVARIMEERGTVAPEPAF